LDQRIIALPIDRANYTGLEPAGEGVLFLLAAPTALADEDYVEYNDANPPPLAVSRFELKKRKAEPFLDKVDGSRTLDDGWRSPQWFTVTADGKKALYARDNKWFLVDTDSAAKGGGAELKAAAGLEVWVDPRAEWRQMYHEVWRIERDFLYD